MSTRSAVLTRGRSERAHAFPTSADLVHRVLQTRAEVSPAITRVALGLLLFPHGAQHFLGWFGGYGFAGTHQWITETLGFHPIAAAIAITTELLAPIALVVGLGGRVAALGVIGLMIGATSTHLENGFFMNWFGALPAGAEGYEYHLLMIVVATGVLLQGSGALSLDRWIASRLGAHAPTRSST